MAAPRVPPPVAHGFALPHASTTAPSTAAETPTGWLNWSWKAPPARDWEAMTYDNADGYELMFGGWTTSNGSGLSLAHIRPDWIPGEYLADTWAYRNQTWSELCSGNTTAPKCASNPPIGPATMAFDPSEHGVILVDAYGDTWLFRAGEWTQLTNTSYGYVLSPLVCDYEEDVCGQSGAPMAYDPATGQLVLVDYQGATWTFTGSNWTRETQVSGASLGWCGSFNPMYFDPYYNDLIYLCDNTEQPYRFNDGDWTAVTNSTAPVGTLAAGDFDPNLGGLVALVYRTGQTDAYTWLLRQGQWTNVSGTLGSGPPRGFWRTMAWDSGESASLLIDGGANGTGDTLLYNGTWALVDPLTVSVQASPSVVEVGQALTLGWSSTGGFGPQAVSVAGVPSPCRVAGNGTPTACAPTTPGLDTLRVAVSAPEIDAHATATAEVMVYPATDATVGANRSTTTIGLPVAYAASILAGDPPYRTQWTWDGVGPTDGTNVVHTWTTVGLHAARFTVTDALNGSWSGTVDVWVNDALATTIMAGVATTDIGVPVVFSAVAAGGTGPYTAYWSFAPGTAEGLSPTVAFLTPGAQWVSVTVRDAAGATALAGTTVQVNPDPELALGAGSYSVAPGTPVPLSLTVFGGTAPYAVNWSFGDGAGGTSIGSGISFPASAVYAREGSYTVQATLTDAAGLSAHAELTLQVPVTAGGNSSVHPPTVAPASAVGMTPMDTAWLVILLAAALGASSLGLVARRRRARR